jgi:crossover junction endodeoxyribonuclease RuvC
VRPATRILGIDPGYRVTGYGIIDTDGQQSQHVANGTIATDSKADAARRLEVIFREVAALVEAYNPDELAVEKVFVAKNADSALKLGQARAAAICASFDRGLPVFEYAAREVKQAIVGKGGAAKDQVQHMVRVLLTLGADEKLPMDASDALGIALCHAHTRTVAKQYAEAMR